MTATDLDTLDETAFRAAWEEWHTAHEHTIGDPHGFLAVTAIHWLDATPVRFDDAPGEWWSDDAGVHVRLAADEPVALDGVRLAGRHDFGVIPERGSLFAAWQRPDGAAASIEIAKRGGHDIVRPRHPDAPLVSGYHGTPAYEPDPRFVVSGRFEPFDAPRPTTVGSAVDGLEHVYEAPGRVRFRLDGREHALTAFTNSPGSPLFILFRDATSGVTTYAANRSLGVPAPAEDGSVVLDFNRAVNLPCAYTDLATCPLPPAENTLTAAVEAGEQIPFERKHR